MHTEDPKVLKEIFEPGELVRLDTDLYQVKQNFESRPRGRRLAVVITGPTGSGKDTIRDLLDPEMFFAFSTWTTRPRRDSEPAGQADPYQRMSLEEFAAARERGEFYEVNEFAGNWYGGKLEDVDAAYQTGRIPVFRPDPEGASSYLELARAGHPPFEDTQLLVVFILPPERELLRERLYNRDLAPYLGTEKFAAQEKKFQVRLALAQEEVARAREAHLVLINRQNESQRAAKQLSAQLLALASSSV